MDTRQEWEYRTGNITEVVNFPMEPTWLDRWRKEGDLGRFLGEDKQRTIVFLDAQGQELHELRIVDYMPSPESPQKGVLSRLFGKGR